MFPIRSFPLQSSFRFVVDEFYNAAELSDKPLTSTPRTEKLLLLLLSRVSLYPQTIIGLSCLSKSAAVTQARLRASRTAPNHVTHRRHTDANRNDTTSSMTSLQQPPHSPSPELQPSKQQHQLTPTLKQRCRVKRPRAAQSTAAQHISHCEAQRSTNGSTTALKRLKRPMPGMDLYANSL